MNRRIFACICRARQRRRKKKHTQDIDSLCFLHYIPLIIIIQNVSKGLTQANSHTWLNCQQCVVYMHIYYNLSLSIHESILNFFSLVYRKMGNTFIAQKKTTIYQRHGVSVWVYHWAYVLLTSPTNVFKKNVVNCVF